MAFFRNCSECNNTLPKDYDGTVCENCLREAKEAEDMHWLMENIDKIKKLVEE